MKIINVVAAVIVHNSKILCVQRGKSKYEYISNKWEFPGGKIEHGETQVEALNREIKEELDLKIEVEQFLMTVNHSYPDFQLTMDTYICRCRDNKVILKEHVAKEWLEKEELQKLDWAAADIPIMEKLLEL